MYHEVAKEPGFTLKAVDLQGESSVFMSLPAPGYEIEEPTPSPDGKYVVARRDEKSIVVIDVANQATQTIDNASSYSWARDGLEVVENNVSRVYRLKQVGHWFTDDQPNRGECLRLCVNGHTHLKRSWSLMAK
ncbi:MAG: hypothetical protein FD169_1456 [Bacillota bacterium]|nr:MAG: hypothetical protein FD169_1456 [Bacillota bacterium]MBS3949439.1 hypothetical protein [Peptococcaceae bacterium]